MRRLCSYSGLYGSLALLCASYVIESESRNVKLRNINDASEGQNEQYLSTTVATSTTSVRTTPRNFNESQNLISKVASSKPIPKCPDGTLWHPETGGCYTMGSIGPCVSPSRIFVQNDNKHGTGECRCRYETSDQDCYGKPVVYWEPTNRCYPLYEKGPCKLGSWLIQTDFGVFGCAPIPCLDRMGHKTPESQPPNATFLFTIPLLSSFTGSECYTSFTQGPCEKGSTAVFSGTMDVMLCQDSLNLLSPCRLDEFVPYKIGTGDNLKCPVGQMRRGGECTVIAEF